MTAAGKPVAVGTYDRITMPVLSGHLGVRVNGCKTWARSHGHPVVGLRIEKGEAATFDGPLGDDWPLISRGHPARADALGLVIEYDKASLVSRRERLSQHQRRIDELLRRWPARLLVTGTSATATAEPARRGGHT